MHSIRGDVRDLERLRTALADAQPDVILHLAAQSVVRASYDDPVETYGTNVMGTVNLFEAVPGSGRPAAVVNVTSDKCYENLEQDRGYREEDRLGGHDPYSSSKACAELVTSAFRDSCFAVPQSGASRVRLASVRAGNVIGGGDWTRDQLLPDTVRSFTAGKNVRLRNPDAVRPWQFVLEPLRGYLMLCADAAMAGFGVIYITEGLAPSLAATLRDVARKAFGPTRYHALNIGVEKGGKLKVSRRAVSVLQFNTSYAPSSVDELRRRLPGILDWITESDFELPLLLVLENYHLYCREFASDLLERTLSANCAVILTTLGSDPRIGIAPDIDPGVVQKCATILDLNRRRAEDA